ncbi:hypothetical protein J1N35_043014 [Gossypium stocksii]|uniref:DUF4283 domain-containing protein n=1 Tax=Gossypium stocksii TaxID=47602 RepID=A0A9D3U6N3_9ROSI|nr:hypothetical protein J1N35_043014 [Gossypium stocksii]
MDIENDYYLVKLRSKDDYTKVLSEGPWTTYGPHLTVQPWSYSFTTLTEFPSEVCVWIRLPSLPGVMYKNGILNAIENTIGKVVKIDYDTKNGSRGRFARMALFVELKRPLVSKLFIYGKLPRVEYERLPNVRFQCGCYGYTKDYCSLNVDRTIKEDEPTNPCPARKMDHSDIVLPIKKDMEVNEEIMDVSLNTIEQSKIDEVNGSRKKGHFKGKAEIKLRLGHKPISMNVGSSSGRKMKETVSLIGSKRCANDADKGITNEPFLSFKATKMKTGLDSLKHTVVRVDENFNLNITVREESESRLVMQSNRKNENTPSVRMMPPDPRDPKMDTGLTFGEGSEVSPRRKENGWVCKTLYPTRITGFGYLML